MENTKSGNRCSPCRCVLSSYKSTSPYYLYSEKIPNKDNDVPNHSRPSSARSMRSSGSNKKTSINSSKLYSSDSKIMKKTATARTKKSKLKNREVGSSKADSESLRALKKDLKTIMKQLFLLTKNKTEALNITKELEVRYNNLLKTNDDQNKEIEDLRFRNQKLLEELNSHKNLNESMKVIRTTKTSLDNYEDKLNKLYNEFLNTSKVMEQSREKLCHCIKKKSGEFETMAKSQREMSQRIKEKNVEYANLLEKYNKSKDNENKCSQRNAQLTQAVEKLSNQLRQKETELDTCRQEAATNLKRHQQELNKGQKMFASELQSKMQEIDNLCSTIEKLRSTSACKCKETTTKNDIIESQYEELLRTYDHTVEKLNACEETSRKRDEEVRMLQQNEKRLMSEMVKLQWLAGKLTNIVNEYNLSISRLKDFNEENESIIQCQKAQLASKNKQIELLSKNEDQLRSKVEQLQEDIVSMKAAQTNNDAKVLCAEDCAVHLTEELQDLISTLYEEVNKAQAKDEQIQKQKRDIYYLQCALSSKEKELIYARDELTNLQEQMTEALRKKYTLAGHSKNVTYDEVEEEYSAECYCDEDNDKI